MNNKTHIFFVYHEKCLNYAILGIYKKQNDSINTQNHNKKNFFFSSEYIRLEMKTQKSIVLKRNMKNLMTSLLLVVKKMINKKINKIGYYAEDTT